MSNRDEPVSVMLSMDQIARALSDYCDAHGIGPTSEGRYRVGMTTEIINGKLDHVRLDYTKADDP